MLRPLRELGGPLVHSLPQCTKDLLKDVGICHYMTVSEIPRTELCPEVNTRITSTSTYPCTPAQPSGQRERSR